MRRIIVASLTAIVVTSGVLLPTSATWASSAKKPLIVAFITSETGSAASEYATAKQGFLARVAMQNAQGGVNGHKIVPMVIDDQTSPTAVVTGVQNAISQGAIGIVADSSLFFLAAKYPQQAGIPVTGGSFDGPEWGEQPYTNMFAADFGSVNPKFPIRMTYPSFLKHVGGTVIASYGYGISPESADAATMVADGFQRVGGKLGVLDTSLPFGGVDFTTPALVAKQKGANSIFTGLDNNSNFALATALKQAGVKATIMFGSGYEPSVVKSPVWSTVQGDYFSNTTRPTSLPNAGTEEMVNALEKYQHRSPADFADFGVTEAWLGTDLMMKGIGLAGANPTSAEVIHSLRDIKAYNANGLLPQNLNFTTNFGHDLPETCVYILKAEKNGFVPVSSKPWCGGDVPGTSVAGSS